MPETVNMEKAELENLQARAKNLAMEKSYLQLIIRLMDRISTVPGLDNAIESMLKNVLDVIGGNNVILYYFIDNDIFYTDVYGKREKLDVIEDDLVRQVFESRQPIEHEHDFQDTKMVTPEFSKAYTWIYPLLVGSDIIGIFKAESLNLAMQGLSRQLPTFFNFAALILKNKILGQTRLQKAHDELAREIVVRKRTEQELRKAKEGLEEKVLERTTELQDTNKLLKQELKERKKAQTALKTSEEKYRTLLQNIQAAVVVHTPDTKIITCNRRSEELLGLTKEQMLGKAAIDPDWHFFREDGELLPLEEYPVNLVISSQKALRDCVVGVNRPATKDRIWVLVNADPVFTKGKELSQIIVTFIDITRRVDTEIALKESEEKYIDLYDNAPDMYCSVDAMTACVKQCNETLCHALGIPREEIIGKPIFSLYHPDCMDKVEDAFHSFISTGIVRDAELQLKRKDGSKLEVSLNVSAVRDEEGNILHSRSVWRDNTERKQLIERLKELNLNLEKRVLEEVEKSHQKDQLLFNQSRHIAMAELLVNLAHQWRQPICAIGAIAQDIEDAYQCRELDEKYLSDSINTIMKEVDELSETIKQFSSFFANEPVKVWFTVEAAVQKSLEMLRNASEHENIEMNVIVNDDCQLQGYPGEFSQAVYNILINAVEIGERRKCLDRGRIDVRITRLRDVQKIRVEIIDNCGGIEKEVLNNIFDPYYTTAAKVRGKGIGLFMARTIIENNMQGTLRAENSAKGAKFIIEVPL